MRQIFGTALIWSVVLGLPAQEQSPLPAFAIYRTVDAAVTNARPYSWQDIEGKRDISGWFAGPPLVSTRDVYKFQSAWLEYSTVPCPGLRVRFTNRGNRALEKNTTRDEKSSYLIVADGKPVGQITGGELWKVGTLRLNLQIVLPLKSGEWNEVLAQRVNEAMKAPQQ